jgi:hypothetical protein
MKGAINMRKHVLLIGLLMLLFTSCEDFLTKDPYDTIGSDEFFT